MMKRLPLFSVLFALLTLACGVCERPAFAQDPAPVPYAAGTYTLPTKDSALFFSFTPATTDPIIFRQQTDDDLAGLVLNVRQDCPTCGTVHNQRSTTVRRNATIEAVYQVAYPDPAKTYFVEIRNTGDVSRTFTLTPLDTRPVQVVTGADAINVPTLQFKGDVRYFQFKPALADSMLFRIQTADDLSLMSFNIRQDCITCGTVQNQRDTVVKRGVTASAIVQVAYPDPTKTYFIEVSNGDTGSRTLSIAPFETRPVQKITGKDVVTGPELNGKGDVRYFHFFADTKDPILFRFRGTDALSNYSVNVRQDCITCGTVHTVRDNTTTHGTVVDEGMFQILYPDPNKDYYIEVASAAEGTRSFTIQPFEIHPIPAITGTEQTNGEELNGKGDVRYYKFAVDTSDPFLIRFKTTDDMSHYSFNVRQDCPSCGTVHSLRGTETDADGVTRTALFAVLYPDPNKFYYMEVDSTADGPRNYAILPLEFRPIAPLPLGQAVTGPALNGNGDVRFYHFNVTTTDPVTFDFQGTDDLKNYNFYVRQDCPSCGTVHQVTASAGLDATFVVNTPDPKKDYYVEVTATAPGTRSFSLIANGTLPPPATTIIPGDLNGDGKVSVADAILTLQFSVGMGTPTADQLKAADLNGDGKISVPDAILVLLKAVGL